MRQMRTILSIEDIQLYDPYACENVESGFYAKFLKPFVNTKNSGKLLEEAIAENAM